MCDAGPQHFNLGASAVTAASVRGQGWTQRKGHGTRFARLAGSPLKRVPCDWFVPRINLAAVFKLFLNDTTSKIC